MSFILDALKKSETDRQQQSAAQFAAVPASAPPPAVPRWLWVVGALLAINLAVLVGVLLRPDTVSVPEQSAQQTAVATNDEMQQSAPSFESRVAAARENAPQQQPIVDDVGDAPETVHADLISQNPAAIPSSDVYPSLQEVRLKGLLDIPELHLDIHVYNPDPEDRFVFINMAKQREGSQLAEGPTVREIAPDGVVLDFEGQTFLLPRE